MEIWGWRKRKKMENIQEKYEMSAGRKRSTGKRKDAKRDSKRESGEKSLGVLKDIGGEK